MADNLVSCDHDTQKIYEHDGFSSTILTSFDSGLSYPSGLAWDGYHLHCCDTGGSYTIKKYDGVSSTVLDSFNNTDQPQGLVWIDPNLIVGNPKTNKIEKHDGFSSTVLEQLDATDGVDGLAWDGTNLYSCDYVTNDIYKHDGFSSTHLGTISVSTQPYGLTFWDPNVINCDADDDKIYKLDGFSTTILESFASPSSVPSGLTHTYLIVPQITSGEVASDNSYCKITFSEAVYSDAGATQTINKDDLSLIFTQNGGGASNVTLGDLYEDAGLTTPLADGTGYDTVYAKLTVTGVVTGAETIEIKPASGSAIYDSNGNAMDASETTGVLALNNVLPSITKGSMAGDNTYVKIDFSEDVWADSGNTTELSPSSFSVTFQQNGGNVSAVSIHALFQDRDLSVPLAAGAGYSTVYAQLQTTSTGLPTGDETIEIKPASGSAIYDASGGAMDASETTGVLHFNLLTAGSAVNWTTLDAAISSLRSIVSLCLISLFGHGLHVFYTDRSLFQEVEAILHSRIGNLPSEDQGLGLELLDFFRRFYLR